MSELVCGLLMAAGIILLCYWVAGLVVDIGSLREENERLAKTNATIRETLQQRKIDGE